MERRFLGKSGLSVPIFSFGTMTFAGTGMFAAIGSTGLPEATRQIDLCLDAGVDLFDPADFYSEGQAEEILGRALGSRRNRALIATKVFWPLSATPTDIGLSRAHIVRACEASLQRLGTDWIDLYQVHNYDALVPLDETLRAMDDLVRAGKVRYIGCSNYAGWQLAKAQAISAQLNLERFVGQQIQYSLAVRESEFELLPAGTDLGVGALIWSPLAMGLLSGKSRTGASAGTRIAQTGPRFVSGPIEPILDALFEIAEARRVSASQVALNWIVQRRGVASVIVGARTAEQLVDNLAAANWSLTVDEMTRLTAASGTAVPYPYSMHRLAAERNPDPYA